MLFTFCWFFRHLGELIDQWERSQWSMRCKIWDAVLWSGKSNVTWWGRSGRSDRQLRGGAVSTVGQSVRKVHLWADVNRGQGLLLDSYRHQGKAGGGGRATLCSTIGTVDSSFHKRGKCDRGGYVCLSFKCIHLFFFQFDLRCFLHRTCIKKNPWLKSLFHQ